MVLRCIIHFTIFSTLPLVAQDPTTKPLSPKQEAGISDDELAPAGGYRPPGARHAARTGVTGERPLHICVP
ncbi:unnamed protein product [Bursaphelenchus xylophilus]|uniref:(pine wood nematode) hypothetical protein n=1 Tax=Bursaphelenchus xylophilus TaxID=6326 RepID=A0A811KNR8_BURXY|nr:unnamed protein product [Bursaphelenchus xylophilus]CAG9102679.1 unnamed protein product [Bursaphelenchus xylophilus]